jgi:hypothetical protein
MNNDISNNYLHHILSDHIRDLSNNPRGQFVSMLVNLINDSNLNSNLAMLPLANNFAHPQISQASRMNQILTNSLLDKMPYKKILSNKGEEQLKVIKYNKESYDQDSCCITFENFEEGKDVIQLPCKHIFDPEGIKTWLKEESSKCPICRYELDFEEVKDNEIEEYSDDEMHPSLLEETDISQNNRYNQMFNNMGMLYSPMESLNRPRRRNLINQRTFVNQFMNMNIENEYIENRQLQNAIINSLHEHQGTTVDSTDDETFESFEEEMYLENFDNDSDFEI